MRTCLAAMNATERNNAGGSARDMDTSMSVLGKTNRTMGETMDAGTAVGGNSERCPRSEALGIALAADLPVVYEHAQSRNPELKPYVGAHHSSVMGALDGAASA